MLPRLLRPSIRLGLAVLLPLWLWLGWASPVWAMTPIKISNLSWHECSSELSQGQVTSNGNSQRANCFIIAGTATNASGKTLYDADVFGRIYDADNNPVMQNRSRVGAIAEVPPGNSDFEIRISVSANQPTPLKLEQFKAAGFSGRVKVTLRSEYEDFDLDAEEE